MADFRKEFQFLLASQAFQTLLNQDTIKFNQLCAVQTLLFKACIPFKLVFTPGTRQVTATAELTIQINPATTVNLVINLEPGGTIFGGFFPD